MMHTGSGHVLSVQSRALGSALDGDQSAGVTTITVQDCADFDDEFGGTLALNGANYTYSNVDDDASTVDITPALAASASDGDDVVLLDAVNLLPQTEWTASVTVDGEDPGDPIEASVMAGLLEMMPEGVRGISGEAVTLTWDENGEVWVTDIGGATASGLRFMQDQFTVVHTGDQTFALTYQPVLNSEHVYWHPGGGAGVYQDGSTWSRSDWTITIPDPGGLIAVGDEFVVEYAYTDPSSKPLVPASLVLVGATELVGSPQTSIALPAGTQEGDLLALACVSRQSSTPASSGDARVMLIAQQGNQPAGCDSAAWFTGVGYADASGSPVSYVLPSASDAHTVLAAFRVTGTLAYAMTDVVAVDRGSPFEPENPHEGDVGVTLLIGESGLIGASFPEISAGVDGSGEWTVVKAPGSGSDGHSSSIVAYSVVGCPQSVWTGLSSGGCWAALTVGLVAG